jgi:hypothetical protein
MGDSRHTFHFLVFHIVFVFAKTKMRVQLGSSTLGLQFQPYNFHATCKGVEGEAFSLASARVPTCPS